MKIIVRKDSWSDPKASDRTPREEEVKDVKKVAIIVTRGACNNLLQACEFGRIATESGVQVSMLFRDEAVARLSVDRVRGVVLSEAF